MKKFRRLNLPCEPTKGEVLYQCYVVCNNPNEDILLFGSITQINRYIKENICSKDLHYILHYIGYFKLDNSKTVVEREELERVYNNYDSFLNAENLLESIEFREPRTKRHQWITNLNAQVFWDKRFYLKDRYGMVSLRRFPYRWIKDFNQFK